MSLAFLFSLIILLYILFLYSTTLRARVHRFPSLVFSFAVSLFHLFSCEALSYTCFLFFRCDAQKAMMGE